MHPTHLEEHDDGHLNEPEDEEAADEGEDAEDEDDGGQGEDDEVEDDEDGDRLRRRIKVRLEEREPELRRVTSGHDL